MSRQIFTIKKSQQLHITSAAFMFAVISMEPQISCSLTFFEFIFKCEPVWTRFALWQLTAVVNYKEVKNSQNLSILNHDEQPLFSGDQDEMLMLFKTSQFLFSCQFVSILDKLYTLLLTSWTFPKITKSFNICSE